MDPYLLDWLQVLVRWLHVITAIAWIGASFYFVWLDNNLEAPCAEDLRRKGVDGELWAVHGGGFYNPQKYLTAPPKLPENLHWFYWESYATWMSGFALFVLVYLFRADVYLIDSRLFPMTVPQAVSAALGFVLGGYIIYDLLCRVLGFRNRELGVAVSVFVALATWLACSIFPGRAAFLMIGAMMATIMSANVLFWIIPGQRKVTAALRAGQPVDPLHGQRGKQRSVHNTYFTLPVLFCMLSNHFSLIYQSAANAIALIILMMAGVLIRQFFILRHKGQLNGGFLATGGALIATVFLMLKPSASEVGEHSAQLAPQAPSHPDTQAVFGIVQERCYGCHATHPTLMEGTPPKGIAFETHTDIEKFAEAIYTQAVMLKAMPVGNITNMTDHERQRIAQWFGMRSTH